MHAIIQAFIHSLSLPAASQSQERKNEISYEYVVRRINRNTSPLPPPVPFIYVHLQAIPRPPPIAAIWRGGLVVRVTAFCWSFSGVILTVNFD